MTDFNCLQLDAPQSLLQHLPFWAQVHRNTGDKMCNLGKLKVMPWFETPKSDLLSKVKAVEATLACFTLWMGLEVSRMRFLSPSHKLLSYICGSSRAWLLSPGLRTPVALHLKVIFQPLRITRWFFLTFQFSLFDYFYSELWSSFKMSPTMNSSP